MPRRRQGTARKAGQAPAPGSFPPVLQRAVERLLSTAPLRACRQQFLQCLQGIDAADFEHCETKCRRLAFLDGNEGADDEETVLFLVCSALCRCDARRDPEEYAQVVTARFSAVFGFDLGYQFYVLSENTYGMMMIAQSGDGSEGDAARSGDGSESDEPDAVEADRASDLTTSFAIKLQK